MSRKKRWLYALLSGLLLSLGWFQWSTGLFTLIGLIPLLFIEDYFYTRRSQYASIQVFWYAWLTFLIWNLAATWWVWNASAVGMFVAVGLNALFTAIVFWAFHLVRRAVPGNAGYFGLVFFWTFWEYCYLNAEISWPWLNLGNAFANDIHLIQWYEYTGSLGGTIWILGANILIFGILKHFSEHRSFRGKMANLTLTVLWLVVPIIISTVIFYNYKEKERPYRIVVIQPNVDPYEKFVAIPGKELTNEIIDLAALKGDSSTDYFVAPETALLDDIWLDRMDTNESIIAVRTFMHHYPRAKFIVGIMAYKLFRPGEKLSATAQEIENTDLHYDSYNSAIQIDSTPKIQIYHKSKLVVGVEKMPYPQYLGFLKKLTLRLGGTFRSHATQPYRSVLRSPQDSLGVAPVICYESVFGEYVTDYLKKDAGFIFIITNDGWWGNTPGYRQHFSYARIRAIETRRSIARSANTGISGFINQRGEVLMKTNWWEPVSIKGTLNANNDLTYYTRHGDYLARISGWFALLTALYAISRKLMQKRHKNMR